MVITRRRHPFEGCRLAVINGLTRHGVPLLLVVLPDGSRSLIPSAWTDWFGSCGVDPPGDVEDGEDLCAVGDLIKARAVIDALLSRLAESVPREEGDHAVGVGVSRTARAPAARMEGPWDQIDPQAQIAALDILSRLIAQMLAAGSTLETSDE